VGGLKAPAMRVPKSIHLTAGCFALLGCLLFLLPLYGWLRRYFGF